MTTPVRIFKGLCLVPFFVIAIIEGIWLIAIPEEFISEKLSSSIPLMTRLEGIKKGPFFALYINRLSIGTENFEIPIENLKISLHYPSLLKIKLMAEINGHMGDGKINGIIGRAGGEIKAIDINLSSLKIPSLEGNGILNLTAEIQNGTGGARFSITKARLKPVQYRDLFIPLDLIETVKGSVIIKQNEYYLESVTLSGKDIFGRLKGSINKNTVDLVLELMPEGNLNNTLMLLIPKALVSPGYFRIDIKRSL